MRQSQMGVVLCLMLVGLLSAACGGSNSPTSSETNRVATRVAEEISVAATLTALAPRAAAPPALQTRATTSTPTLAAIEPAVPSAATQAPASTAAPTDAPPAASCRVITAGLNLRPGPGTVYAPPLAGLARDAELRPLSFVARGFPAGQWIEVQAISNGRQGWVSAGQPFVACNVAIASLPAGVPPPTPTPAPTTIPIVPPVTIVPPATTVPPLTILPPASPTVTVQVAVVPVDGSDGNQNLGNDRGVNSGRNLLLPGFAPYEVSTPLIFRDRIVFQAEVFDKSAGQTDGAGIESVTFTIRDENGNQVHERTERNAGYCVFGGGEPDCTVWRFSEHGNKWPGGAKLQPGVHDAQIVITPKNGDAVTWFWSFQIER